MDLFSSKSGILYQINHHNIINAVVTDKLGSTRDLPLRRRKLLSIGLDDIEQSHHIYLKYSHASNHLIYQNFVLDKNLKYWNAIKFSWCYRLLYGLQILPFRVYDIFQHYRQTGTLQWESPLKLINREVKAHISGIEQQLQENCRKLGALIADMNSPSEDTLSQVWDGTFAVQEMQPGWWQRHWITVSLLVFFGPIYSVQIFRNRNKYLDWISDNVVGLATGFYRNWIVAPIQSMVSTIKQDDNIISSKESLNSDLQSLERMITDYLVDDQTVDYEQIKRSIQLGDMTQMMQKYEQEIKSPFKNILRGDLVRGLLIQVQKTKVDGDLAISGIDKLIKSQQLLLALVSLSPTVLILYQLYFYATRTTYVINGKDVKLSCIRHLDSLAASLGDELAATGQLLVSVVNLKIESKMIMKREIFQLFEADLNQLVQARDNTLLIKIYNFYLPYFH